MSNNVQAVNDNLVLITGKSAGGKSASLRNLKDPEGVMYLNCESGKKLPFRAKFKEYIITDPLQVNEAFAFAETRQDIHTVVVDTLTYLMDMYESQYVRSATNGQKAWGEFAFFFKDLMQQEVAKSTKNVIFLAHSADKHNEAEMVTETAVPVKGSLKNNGIESYFSLVISAKKMDLRKLAGYQSALLNITPQEQALGFKHVFQTQLTKETVNERLRGPMGMFDHQETYVDNDAQLIINRLHEYYG